MHPYRILHALIILQVVLVQVKFLTSFTLIHTQESHHPLKRIGTRTRVCARATVSNIESASISVAGMDPDSPGKVNQDATFHSSNCKSAKFVYGGVLDGHGKKGHILNKFLGSCIPRILHDKLEAHGNDGNQTSIDQILIETFESAHLAARMDESVPAGRSGTTCVVTVIDVQRGVVYTGNVGDSRAILAVRQNENDDGEWKMMPLSTETTTKRGDERARIEENEGRIDSGGNVWYGPIGIAMTRALGDAVMKRAGVIPTPEIACLNLDKELEDDGNDNGRKYTIRILIGSDGIFDVMKNEEANAQINGKSLQQGCEDLVNEARRKWKGGLPLDVRIDDTSVVLISFQYSK